ncbi:SH3 domain-containing protein 19 isoform X1 [Pygocentrus nattereri]|uniref:SH3 domain-containing protein n=1 Tax=Pygocentrus nattereri TaxID=42514 RepID=A0AAR2JC12_PYGNA|nr:SH3 domain-containing protein 19 isoform X1 [Pygocentrus nattereri]
MIKRVSRDAAISCNSCCRSSERLFSHNMAEARTEDEEESLREPRGGGRNPRLATASSEQAERNKPEQRHSSSQGALSSIRAVIKRTSNRTTAQTDNSRDRRRPEITILSAEPLATNWFPGASGAFPPPPPPAQPSWASGGLTVQLPPPSYEQVIREKSREQNTQSSSVSSSSSSSPTPRRSTTTIATQTETGSCSPKNRIVPPAHRPPKPPRPSLPIAPKPAEFASAHTCTLIELDKPDLSCTTNTPTTTHGSDILSAPLSEQCGVQTDFTDVPDDLAPLETTPTTTDSSHITNDPPLQHSVKQEVSTRPRPRPRSKAILQPVVKEEVLDQAMTREVKVKTLVRLKDDGSQSVFAGFTDSSSDISSNKYLQELLDAFGYDEQGVQGNQEGESDQSEKSEEDESASESCVASSVPTEPLEPLKRPQPKPRALNPKPVISPKPSEPMQEQKDAKSSSEEKNKQTLNPPVPAPRPLLTNKLSEGNRPDANRLPRPPRPPIAARRSLVPANSEEAPSAHETAAVPPKSLVDDEIVDDQARNSLSAPVKPAPFTSARGSGKCPNGSTQTQVPLQRRPPPPSNPNAQAAVSGVSVSKAPASSVPSLPPRPSEGRLLPLRPPPIKLSKSAGSTHAPATSSQHPSHRVPKRRPPLPPRPKPGHPLYRDYMSKVPQGNTKMNHVGTEPQEHYLQKEELLLVLDDTPLPAQTPSIPGEMKDQVQDVYDDVCPAVRDEPISQQKQNQEMKIDKQKEQKPQPNTDIRCVARFAFEGQEGELMFHEGDVITLIEYVNEEWGRGSFNGHTGLFPLNFVQEVPSSQRKPTPESPEPPVCERENQTGRALYDFTAESEDELCLKMGDIVCSLEEVDEEWFMGEFAGKRGIIPKNYIQVL